MKTVFGVNTVTDLISPAVDTSNPAVAELPQKAKVYRRAVRSTGVRSGIDKWKIVSGVVADLCLQQNDR